MTTPAQDYRRPRWPDAMAEVRNDLEAVLRRTPFVAHLGGELIDWGLGWSVMRLEAAPSLANLAGTVHGGALFGLADAAFEIACNSYGRRCVAIDTACHYTRPGQLGVALIAIAEEVSRSRRTSSYRITISEDGDDTPTAWYMAQAYRTGRWHLGENRYPDDWRDRY